MSAIFDFENREVKSRAVFAGHLNSVDAVRFQPGDAGRFASGSHDHSVRIWDVEKTLPAATFPVQTEGVWSLDWSVDGRLLLSTGPAGKVYVTEVASGKPVTVIQAGLQKGYCVKFEADQRKFVVCGQNGSIERYAVGSSTPEASYSVPDRIVYAWSATPSGKEVLASTSNGEFLMLNEDLSLKHSFSVTKHEIRSFVFVGDDLVAGFQNGDLKTLKLDAESGTATLGQQSRGHRADLTAMVYSASLDLLVTGAKDSSVFSWSARSRRPLHHLVGHKDQIGDLALNSQGTTLVTASWDQTLRAYSVADLQA